MTEEWVAGSFRDPAGFVFRRDGIVYRQVNKGTGAEALRRLEASDLYGELTGAGLLVPHEPASVEPPQPDLAYQVIRPEQIPFISYPYEWCFGQLKDAALATLDIQLRALDHDISLKDASAFNIQFRYGRPVFIDTLSFEPYDEGRPWVAYRQFCEHFLGPLLLISKVDPWLGRSSALTADGIPIETTSRLLSQGTWLRPTTLLHIHLHARSVKRYGDSKVPPRIATRGLSRSGMTNLIEGLGRSIESLNWSPVGTEWAEYETDHGYTDDTIRAKELVVRNLLQSINGRCIWDLGANTGHFSRVAAEAGASVVAMDFDPAAVERNYRQTRDGDEAKIHPLWVDLLAPTPAVGWDNTERSSLTERSTANVVLALALIHHLAIGGNVPFGRVFEWMARLAPHVIVEWIPKSDPQVSRLLVSREDVFADYTRDEFELAMKQWFNIQSTHALPGTERAILHGTRNA